MKGAFGGDLAYADGITHEAVSAEYSAALDAACTEPNARTEDTAPRSETASLLWFDVHAERVAYSGDLSAARSLEAGAQTLAETLALIAKVTRRVSALHDAGIVHGDLRPEMIWYEPNGDSRLSMPSRRSKPGAVLRARLHPGGCSPASVAFAAPEVIAGFEVTPASDVFALAAIAHLALTGFAPLGQVDLRAASTGALGAFVPFVYGGLNAVPANRPTIAQFISALDGAVRIAMDPTLLAAETSYRGVDPVASTSVGSAAQAASVRAETSQTSLTLMFLLAVGGIFAFSGAALLVFTGWDVVGERGRLAMLAALSVVVYASGSFAKKKGFDSSGRALEFAAITLALLDASYAFSLLENTGRTVFLAVIVASALGGGMYVERNGSPRSGLALVTLGTQLLWLLGGWVIHLSQSGHVEGSVSILAACVTALTYALALHRKSAVLEMLTAADFAVFAAAFGAYVSTGTVTGPALYLLAVAAGYAVLTAGFALRKAIGLGGSTLAGAVLCALGSVLAGLKILDRNADTHLLFGVLWPYVVFVIIAIMARAITRYRAAAGYSAAMIMAFTPMTEALIRPTLPYALVAVAAGFAFIVVGFLVASFARDPSRQFQMVCVGVLNATLIPTTRLLEAAQDKTGAEILASPAVNYLLLVFAVSVGLVIASLVFSKYARVNTHYRMMEFAALAQLFGSFTLLSVGVTRDWFWPGGALVMAALTLAAGLKLRRSALTVLSAATILLNAWIQYFVRLQGVLPIAVLLVGFGAGLLALGVWYEKNLKQWLPQLREWA